MAGTKITDKNVLLRQLVWVLLTYRDGSEFCFQTTLNPEILRERGVILEEGKLVRLDKKYYWGGQYIYRQFAFGDAVITLWDSLTYSDRVSYKLHPFL